MIGWVLSATAVALSDIAQIVNPCSRLMFSSAVDQGAGARGVDPAI
jgi:hypothetical protein